MPEKRGGVRRRDCAARLTSSAASPCPSFRRHQSDDDRKQRQGDLRCPRQIGPGHPGGVDRDGQRPDAEKLGGADIVQRLHQRETDADGDRRAAPAAGQRARRSRAGECRAFVRPRSDWRTASGTSPAPECRRKGRARNRASRMQPVIERISGSRNSRGLE